MLLLLYYLVLGGTTVVPEEIPLKYYGYSVLRAKPTTEKQVSFLRQLGNDSNLDFWLGPNVPNEPTDVMVPAFKKQHLQRAFQNQQIDFDVLIPDVQRALDEDEEDDDDVLTGRISPTFFDNYQRLHDIQKFMDSLASEYPDISEVFSIGNSYESKDLKGIKIGSKGRRKKPLIWIDAGIHAREWVAPSTSLFIASQLISQYANDKDVKLLVNTFDWYILPVANPDGYEYTHTTSRFWRKTRSQTRSFWGCKGVDPNRNFGFKWNTGGASDEPCSDIFAGNEPFSEPETKNMAKFLENHKDQLKLYLTFHSYGQYWFTPWGYADVLPKSYNQMVSLAKDCVKALSKKYGTQYEVGSSAKLLYVASGGSDDWVHGVLGVDYVYTVELRDRGAYGFTLPKRYIIPVGEETWDGVKTMALLLKERLRI